ncbi:hypothetical protein KKG41_04370 [Patescibacteria group bacterium]|nr:hypothetical protein [Patescibacteria group bacterium]MBU1890788.1 hypothetical protein [Patescibacteria group bacterium]
MEASSIIVFIIAFLEILLGFYVLSRNKKDPINISFFIVVMGVVIWICSNAIISFLSNENTIELIYRLTYIAGAIIAGGFLYFSWVFPYKMSFIRWSKWLLLLIPTIFLIIFTFTTDFIVSGVVKYPLSYDTTSGSGYGLYVLIFVAFFLWAFYELFRKLRRSDGIHHWQLKFVLISVLIPFVVSLVTDIILPWTGYDRGMLMMFAGSMSSAVWLGLNGYILFKK